jgi:ribosomal protein L11 methylase PrmA
VSKKANNSKSKQAFSRKKLLDLLRSLEEGIQSFSYDTSSGAWSGYYDEASQREGYLEEKKQTIDHWLQRLQFKTVLDAGANEGTFSEMVINRAERILSLDGDHFSVNNLYKKTKEKQWTNLYPFLLDLANPWPAIGVNNKERSSFISRAQSDLVMALAVIHHLAIGKNISFEQIIDLFRSFGKTLIIEFVPKDDPKIQLMLSQKRDVYFWYTEENFVSAFSKKFEIKESKKIQSSGRTLYLMEAHDR